MTILNVQFADSTDAAIIAYFGAPQNATIYANLGTVDTSDARWSTYYGAQNATAQKYLPAPTT